jgi:hypothetical protein
MMLNDIYILWLTKIFLPIPILADSRLNFLVKDVTMIPGQGVAMLTD